MANGKRRNTADRQATYRITVQGRLDERWSEWFGGMAVTVESENDPLPITTLVGTIVDQAALRGILTKMWDLGLTLVSVARLDKGPSEEE
jgi:hypothetical protein